MKAIRRHSDGVVQVCILLVACGCSSGDGKDDDGVQQKPIATTPGANDPGPSTSNQAQPASTPGVSDPAATPVDMTSAAAGDPDPSNRGEAGHAADAPAPMADPPGPSANAADGSSCGASDAREAGIQGDANPGTVNCGLTLLSKLPATGSAQGSGHCAYVRAGSVIKAYSLADPLNPVETDQEPALGSSESMRARTVDGRAILVSGRGVYDISDCEDMVLKGEIPWPSQAAQTGLYFAAITSHEISISHDAMRVYTGLGFGIAHIEDLERPETWTVKNWTCEMNKQSNYAGGDPNACEGATQPDEPRQYSHSSDDNLEGTVWYGAHQNGGSTALEPATARMVDISDPDKITILDSVVDVPGHSMNWWRTPSGREFIIGANEAVFGSSSSCDEYPRDTSLGNALDAYVVEVTGNEFGEPFPLTVDINKPENCQAAQASGVVATITEHSVYNRNGAAFVMIEFGGAGLRLFDLRNGENPQEVAYYNDGAGFVHSGVFHYDDARGIVIASGTQGAQVLMLQPQAIEALGLPHPSDPGYPFVE